MENKKEQDDSIKIACPCCGKVYPVRILDFSGTMRYSVRCRICKKQSEVELKK